MTHILYLIFKISASFIGLLYGIVIAAGIVKLISVISNYIETKNAKMQQDILISDSNQFNVRIESTTQLLKLIEYLVEVEITEVLKSYARLEEPYPAIKMTEDIELVAQRVYKAFKSTTYNNTNLLLTDDYILGYINLEVSLQFIATTQRLNNALKS